MPGWFGSSILPIWCVLSGWCLVAYELPGRYVVDCYRSERVDCVRDLHGWIVLYRRQFHYVMRWWYLQHCSRSDLRWHMYYLSVWVLVQRRHGSHQLFTRYLVDDAWRICILYVHSVHSR